MTEVDRLQQALSLPPVAQVGIVVNSVDKTAEFYTCSFGIGPFNI